MALLYADECFSKPVVDELRKLGHDVLTAQEASQANQQVSDVAQLAFAAAHDRAIVSFNRRHFKHLHQAATPHRGIIICTRDDDVAALVSRIHAALMQCPALDDQLIDIIRPHTP
jgi:hypothetical protein